LEEVFPVLQRNPFLCNQTLTGVVHLEVLPCPARFAIQSERKYDSSLK
jgi:hypothetical protein